MASIVFGQSGSPLPARGHEVTPQAVMGLATIDSRSQKEHTEIHKIPTFGVNQASFHRDTAI